MTLVSQTHRGIVDLICDECGELAGPLSGIPASSGSAPSTRIRTSVGPFGRCYVHLEFEPARTTVAIHGDLTAETLAPAREALALAIEMGKQVIVYLCELGSLDFAGLAVLIRASEDAERAGRPLGFSAEPRPRAVAPTRSVPVSPA